MTISGRFIETRKLQTKHLPIDISLCQLRANMLWQTLKAILPQCYMINMIKKQVYFGVRHFWCYFCNEGITLWEFTVPTMSIVELWNVISYKVNNYGIKLKFDPPYLTSHIFGMRQNADGLLWNVTQKRYTHDVFTYIFISHSVRSQPSCPKFGTCVVLIPLHI